MPVVGTVSIDYLNNTYYLKSDSILIREEKPQYNKNQKNITFLENKLFLDEVIYISINIPEEDLQDVIETTTYEVLALDMSASYIIKYIEIFQDNNENSENSEENTNRQFHVFVILKKTFDETFKSALDTFEYLDYIVPIPLLFKSIYSQNLISSSGVHAFIYLQHNDAFITIYKNSEFIYTKSFKFTLNHLHELFCELLGENLPYNDFCNLLEHDGLSICDNDTQKYLLKLFGMLFLHIKKDILPHAIHANNLSKIDHIYISSDLGSIRGVTDFSKTFLATATSKLNFNYGFKSKEKSISQIHQLLQLYEQQIEDQRYECNFVQEFRPPHFLKRPSGQLVITLFVAISLSLAWPFAIFVKSYSETYQKKQYENEYVRIHTLKLQREKDIKKKIQRRDKLKQLLKEKKEYLKIKFSTLNEIESVKSNYPMKAKIVSELVYDLNHFKVQLDRLEYSDDTKKFTLYLNAKDHINITRLLRHFTHEKSSKYNFNMNGINFNQESKRYYSTLKVGIK